MSRLTQIETNRTSETIMGVLEAQAAVRPTSQAIGAPGRAHLTYEALLAQVRDTAAALALAGCGRGQRVALVMGHGPELATASICIAASAVCVPLNPDYTGRELRELMRRLRVAFVVTAPDRRPARDAAVALGLPCLDIAIDRSAPAGTFRLELGSARARPGPPGDPEALLDASPADLALVLHTSGSSALPKIVPLTHRNLLASAANVAQSLRLGPEDVCLSTLPLFHIGALVDLLVAPLSVGGRVVIAKGMSGADFLEQLDEVQPTWYQAVPTTLQDILRCLERTTAEGLRRPQHRLRFVRSVSAPLPPTILGDFERALGVPVIEIYGMTETAGVITSNPLPPGMRKSGSVGIAAGPEVTIVDDAGNTAVPGRRGEVLVRGPSVTAGYESFDGTDADCFLNGWLRTGDEGYFDADGYLHLTGRLKDIINRGGEKIAPREIDELVLGHPDVRDAAAFPLPHATLGEEVAMAVVPAPGRSIDPLTIRAWCAERLAGFKVPRAVFVLDALPRTPGGKLQRRRLPALCLPRNGTGGNGADPIHAPMPTNARQALLLQCWREILGEPGVGVDDDFFERGGDSLRAVELALRVSERLGLEIPVAMLYDHTSVGRFDRHLDAHGHDRVSASAARGEPHVLEEVRNLVTTWAGTRAAPDSLLVGRNTFGSRPPLYWGAQGFPELRDLADRLGPDQPVFGMRSLYETRSKSPENISALARLYRAEIESLQPQGPIFLGGYCAGARVAFEVARELREAGRTVATLCLVEHFSPEPYDGRVAFFFGTRSGWHPFTTANPAWSRNLRGQVRLHPSRAGHEKVLQDERIIAALRQELEDAASPSPSRPPAAGGGGARSANGVSPPRVLVSRALRDASVDVTNLDDVAWPAGTAVFARWGRPGSDRVFFDSYARIEEPVPAGARVRVGLDVQAPLAPGPWTLSFQVVPGGDWSTGPVRTASRRLTFVVPGTAVWTYVRRSLEGIGPGPNPGRV